MLECIRWLCESSPCGRQCGRLRLQAKSRPSQRGGPGSDEDDEGLTATDRAPADRPTHPPTGWAREGAVQDQIDDTVKDGVQRAKSRVPQGESAKLCDECAGPIPEARRRACASASNASKRPTKKNATSAATTAAAAKTASCADGSLLWFGLEPVGVVVREPIFRVVRRNMMANAVAVLQALILDDPCPALFDTI